MLEAHTLQEYRQWEVKMGRQALPRSQHHNPCHFVKTGTVKAQAAPRTPHISMLGCAGVPFLLPVLPTLLPP